ncbi:uncharacterized protein LOC120346974 isoform X1 [Styela clava]
MSAAWTNSAKMDKYFCIAILFSFAVAIHASLFDGLLNGSGETCTESGDCTQTNEFCFETDNNQCWCPAGFTGDGCTEPNTNFIDDRCQLPTQLDDTCFTKEETDFNRCYGGCPDGTICCSTGCGIGCVDPPGKNCFCESTFGVRYESRPFQQIMHGISVALNIQSMMIQEFKMSAVHLRSTDKFIHDYMFSIFYWVCHTFTPKKDLYKCID